ncbi:MAG TPA: hypothetical protein VF200_07570 [Woeseiaceae bacterium]
MSDLTRPDGIESRHVHAGGTRLHAWPIGLVLFGLVLVVAGLGVFGARAAVSGAAAGVRLSVEGPKRIRSGEMFEMLFTVETERAIRDAVLTVDPAIWKDVTVNTFMPQPADERFEDGAFAFHFGALSPGSRLLVKVDGQINPIYPPGPRDGTITLVDGAATLVSVDYSIKVFP